MITKCSFCHCLLERDSEEQLDDVDELLKNYVLKSKLDGFVNLSEILSGFRETIELPEDWINSKWCGKALLRLGKNIMIKTEQRYEYCPKTM